jgi:hypothetical protein
MDYVLTVKPPVTVYSGYAIARIDPPNVQVLAPVSGLCPCLALSACGYPSLVIYFDRHCVFSVARVVGLKLSSVRS